ncbi:uncharacterized protein BDZ99DRAFT_448803 [Mytilinidion resinicola]|uniref:Integral membrane protein n=1 Tax=Mytilinidion resinicola TaxID=574789 RepID=A0A6A6YEN4_9PEZI|nr:uncharacterized protein BDZ99DRAFT_448803 [Mytilinidion resinicola]KAF2807069.1 hypothetical protein BDZ99DRAFT_448803 [Mytilinidion resinicola]
MPHPPTITPGRLLLTLISLFCIIGPLKADFNHTHIHNPAWPPHAKFHNGQTMSLGVLLGALTLYYTWRTPYLTPTFSVATTVSAAVATRKDSITTAALLGSLYWVAGVSAIWYPGTAWVDPEFRGQWGGREDPQKRVFTGLAVGCVVAWGLERWSLAAWEGRVKRE